MIICSDPSATRALEQDAPPRVLSSHLGGLGPDPSQRQSKSQPLLHRQKILLIGASTGGIDALIKVLSIYPAQCPPTVIVQHTGRNFGLSLAKLLDSRCPADVLLCDTEVELRPGRVCLVAGTDGHAEMFGTGYRKVRIVDGPPVNGHRPSIDRLFQSALPIATQIEAAVLTGMGRDGAAGLLALRLAGAGTLVQDENSSVVYGMPRVAWEAGAALRQLPIDEIGPALLASAGGKVR